MKCKSFVFILAFLGILSAIWVAKKGVEPPPEVPPRIEPSQKPYSKGIAASGIIEAVGENFCLGSPEDGIVQHVYKNVWDEVKKGDPLFQLDTRVLEAELKVAEAKEEVALAQHQRIHDQFQRLRSIKNSRAISQEELRSKENEARIATSTLHQMKKEREKVAVLMDRLTIRSPLDGIVIQKNIKVGEHLVSGGTPPMILGNMAQFQVRADVDEYNASRLKAGAAGIAYPKNCPNHAIPLTFIRIDPYVVPKMSLTGSSQEKVDTRVLQVIYTFEKPAELSLYIGQQVDVYIEQAL